jgi:hypothetical protein
MQISILTTQTARNAKGLPFLLAFWADKRSAAAMAQNTNLSSR